MKRSLVLAACIFVFSLALAPFAGAQEGVWASAPSGLSAGETVDIFGGGLEPGQAFMLTVSPPNGAPTQHHVLTADAAGEFAFSVGLDAEGEYVVGVWDVSGSDPKLLTQTILVAGP